MKFQYLVYIFFALFVSCVEEDDFIDTSVSIQLIDTDAVTTLFTSSSTYSDCFDFVYPLTLKLSNDDMITATSGEGLQQIIKAQQSQMYISGIQLPFSVQNRSENQKTIANKLELYALMRQCSITPITNSVQNRLSSCVEFIYPITASTNEISSAEEFANYLNTASIPYEFDVKYPFTTKQKGRDSSVRVANAYELYEVINSCKTCIDYSISVERTSGQRFAFTLDSIIDHDKVQSVTWTQGTNFITNSSPPYTAFFEFSQEDTYTICAEIEYEGCLATNTKCVDVTTENECQEISIDINREQNRRNRINFNLSEGEERLENPVWSIDNEEIDVPEDTQFSMSRVFLEPGSYTVCFIATDQECQNTVQTCEVVVVEATDITCPEPHFVIEKIDDLTYSFFADFENIDIINYEWFVNREFVEREEIGSTSKDDLLRNFKFEPNVNNIVCIRIGTDECGQVMEFCEQISTIPPFECTELDFSYKQVKDDLYEFTAEFDQKERVTYEWIVNNGVADRDGGLGGDHLLRATLDPGSYDFCIKLTDSDCDQQEICKTVVIKEYREECPELVFEQTGTGNGSERTFEANFSGRNELTYEWIIDGDVVETEQPGSADHQLIWQFSKGSYTVCIQAEIPNCANGTSFCKKITVE